MKNFLKTAAVLMGCGVFLAACGEKVEVPPAYVGKVLTKNGFAPETIPPSRFRLPLCWAYCDKLVVMQVSDRGITESFELFMPKDQLNMSFDFRMTLAVKNDENTIDSVMDRVPSQVSERGNRFIGFDQIYEVYGKPIMRRVIRATVADYSINEVAANRERVSQEVGQAVIAALEASPFRIVEASMADVQFPEVITQAKIQAAERREQIQREEAQKQVQLVQLQTQLEVAKQQRAIRREKAQAIEEENEILARSVTDKYLQYKTLEVLETLAQSENNVFVPMSALDSLGLQQRIFQTQQ